MKACCPWQAVGRSGASRVFDMDMSDSKPFDPTDIDETLTRVVSHGGKTHLLFPYVNGVAAEPKYDSIGMPIAGSAASVQDFQALSLMVKRAGEGAAWRIVFNTPWLVRPHEDGGGSERKRRG
jgi:hypothetical protein